MAVEAFLKIKVCCFQELEAIRDALTPPLACAAAKIGDIEALEALKDMVSNTTVSSNQDTLTAVMRKKKKVFEHVRQLLSST